MYKEDEEDLTIYEVVVNHEEQYSIWPDYKDVPLGWSTVGKSGLKRECLDYIGQVWTDMRPLSLRIKMAEMERRRPELEREHQKKLEEREHTSDITTPVKQLIRDNHICVIRTCHLYDLWLETLKGLPVQSVFDKLFDCEGIYEP